MILASLTFQGSVTSVALGIALASVTAALCWLSWRRSGYSRGTGVLECIRFSIVVLVAITLNQPEWLESFQPDDQPTLLVLHDVSNSMQTRDVLPAGQTNQTPQTRAQAIQPLIQADLWKPLSAELNVVIEPFSSELAKPEDATNLHAALSGSIAKHPNLRGLVVISDGDWNLGEPPAQAASQLRLKKIPAFVIGAGSESRLPDVELARFDAPTFGVISKALRIPFVIQSALPQDYDVTVSLTTSDGEQVTKQVRIPAMDRLEDAILWKPTQIGDVELTLSIPQHENELVVENNERTVPIAIREETLKVLLVESTPRWEYRYLRNALERDPGVDVSCLLFHPGLSKVGGGKGYLPAFPGTLEELSQYDVVCLGDVGVGNGELTTEQCRMIKGLVQSQASGLILIPGIRGSQFSLLDTELSELYPVAFDASQPKGWGSRVPSQFELTESGRRSLLTKLEDSEDENARVWASLPGFQWHAPALRAKAGTEVLAVHKTESNRYGRIPLIVTRTFGTGKVLFMGTDGAWRWREGVEDKYHYRFWGQVARWMAYQRNIARGENMRLFYSPDRPEANEVVTLNANVMGPNGAPLQRGKVTLQIIGPTDQTETVRLTANDDEWGLFTGAFTPTEPGDYQLQLSCRENNSTLNANLAVQGVQREQLGQPARFDVLAEIARVTQGRLVGSDEVETLFEEIATIPPPEAEIRRLRIWCHPLWGAFLVLLLGIFWTGRKMIGAV
ncbi:MAG: hypothetical protein GY768_05835 [Planctomycetaceae bacterium]|nr:hypothetical protein [Planctomycetaceae bacterium]